MSRETMVYQVTKLPECEADRPLIVAMTSKASAQRLIAALAEQGEADRYRVSNFMHPELPLEVSR